MALADLSDAQKAEYIVSLAALLCHDAEIEPTAQNLESAVKATGNKVPSYWTTLFASFISRAGGCEKFLGFGGGGGGGGGGGVAASGDVGATAAAAAAAPEPEEEEEVDMGGAMDMFGGGGDGGDY